MTVGIVMLGAPARRVAEPEGTNGYASAFGRAERILSRVTSLGNETPLLA